MITGFTAFARRPNHPAFPEQTTGVPGPHVTHVAEIFSFTIESSTTAGQLS